MKLVSHNLLNEFASHHYSRGTQRVYGIVLRDFFKVDDLRTVSLEQIREVNIHTAFAYERKLIEKGLRKTTVRLYLSILRSFFGLLEENRVMPNPFKSRFLRVKCGLPHRPALSKSQCQQMLENTRKLPLRRTLITLLINTGLRICEVQKIRLGDFKEKEGLIGLTVTGKGEKEREVLVNSYVWSAVCQYLKGRRRDPRSYLFRNGKNQPYALGYLSKVIRIELAKIGVKAGSHTLRRSFATLTHEAGAELVSLQEALGHSSVQTTRTYIQSSGKLKNSPSRLLIW